MAQTAFTNAENEYNTALNGNNSAKATVINGFVVGGIHYAFPEFEQGIETEINAAKEDLTEAITTAEKGIATAEKQLTEDVSDDKVQVCHNRLKALYFPACTSEDQVFHLRDRSDFRMDFQYKYSFHPHKISITAHLMLVPCCSQIILSVWSVPVSGFRPHAEADCRCFLYLYR